MNKFKNGLKPFVFGIVGGILVGANLPAKAHDTAQGMQGHEQGYGQSAMLVNVDSLIEASPCEFTPDKYNDYSITVYECLVKSFVKGEISEVMANVLITMDNMEYGLDNPLLELKDDYKPNATDSVYNLEDSEVKIETKAEQK